ncbi:hypothetical protein EG329_013576 [Mollisiaceae sp. DMI_Dod_QoI]|nr:hypothetical protein EG329_013576 [Helotiales sp. DMI_Dod_QoI]
MAIYGFSISKQTKVRIFWNIDDFVLIGEHAGHLNRKGSIHLFHLDSWRLAFPSVQMYALPQSAPPDWDFIPQMEHILPQRRRDFPALLKKWLSECDAAHDSCRNPAARLPSRVIDVGSEAQGLPPFLYRSSGEPGSYVALSHCWGKAPILRTLTSNVQHLQEKIDTALLPKSFNDAIAVTQAIGIRYLWIDSLCIIQDDKSEWEVESSKMATIYRDAYVVLAASQAVDASVGMLDCLHSFDREAVMAVKVQCQSPGGPANTIYARRKSAGSLDRTSYSEEPAHDVRGTPLARRAWALQEALLSRRIVHFTEDELLWECVRSCRCECSYHDLKPDCRIRSPFIRSDDLYGEWRHIMKDFIVRSITHETDRLPALSGVAKYFQSLGAGQYLAGHWREDLVNTLLWHPSVEYDNASFKRAEPYKAPTWSPFSLIWDVPKMDRYGRDSPPIRLYQDYGEPCVRVVDAGCTPLGLDSTGEVSAGFLVLSGKLVQAVSKWYPSTGGGFVTFEGGASPEVVFDTMIDTPPRGKERLLHYFLLTLTPHEGTGTHGLVVQPSTRTPGAWERMGLFSYFRAREFRRSTCFQDVEETTITLV